MDSIATLPNADMMQKITMIDAAIGSMPQMDMTPFHHFAKGLYCRELHIPQGALISGKIHKQEHIIILFTGEMTLWTEGGERIRVKAPYFGISPAGTKRLGYAHENTIGMNILATECTDPEEIEDTLTCCSFEEYEQYLIAAKEVPCLG